MFINISGTLATIFYVTTLYPGINRDLSLRKSIKFFKKYRLQMGITSCIIGTIHGLYVFLYKYQYQENIISGLICLSILLILGITSGRWMQRKLGKNWRRLHRLTYLLPTLLIWHILSKMNIWSMFTRFNIFILVSINFLLVLRLIKQIQKILS